jgi:hypothetical protein
MNFFRFSKKKRLNKWLANQHRLTPKWMINRFKQIQSRYNNKIIKDLFHKVILQMIIKSILFRETLI